MVCCCRRQANVAPANMGGVVKLDYTNGDILWMHGFHVVYDPSDTPAGTLNCWSSIYRIGYDPVSNLVWGHIGNGTSQVKLFAFYKSGARKWTLKPRIVALGWPGNLAGSGLHAPMAFDGSGNVVSLASTIDFSAGAHPKITVVDDTGSIVSASADLAAVFTAANNPGYNIWKIGSNYVFNSNATQPMYDASGSLIHGNPSFTAANVYSWVGIDGTTVVNSQGCFIDGTTGVATGTAIATSPTGTGPLHSIVQCGYAGPGWVAVRDNTTAAFLYLYEISTGTTVGIPFPVTFSAYCFYVDGTVAYFLWRTSGGNANVEAWDITAGPSQLWTQTIDTSNDSNIQCRGITIDDDSNIYVI